MLFFNSLFQYKRLTVGALFIGWVGFVCAYLNFAQGAVILTLCVMSALLNSTFNCLIYLTHGSLPPENLFGGTAIIMVSFFVFIHWFLYHLKL